MKRIYLTSFLLLLVFSAFSLSVWMTGSSAQSGRNTGSGEKSAVLNVIVRSSSGGAANSLDKERLLLFDGGIQQQIEYFRADPTGARLILLVDNSQTLRAESPLIKKIAQALIKELYEGDEMMIVGFNEQAEILQDFTGDLKSLQTAIAKFRREGFPKLYDAFAATIEDAFRKQIGVNKRAIILISDGYDRDSVTKYESILATLLNENIVIYAFQAPDRTFGAIRAKDSGPKPINAITGLVESTGGLLFKIDKQEDIAVNAKAVVDELRESWFTLSYTPKGVNPINARRLLITSSDDKISLRTKKLHPAQLR
jgi:Ca-activated chloride channel homolog